jgi:hypothetical protein
MKGASSAILAADRIALMDDRLKAEIPTRVMYGSSSDQTVRMR